MDIKEGISELSTVVEMWMLKEEHSQRRAANTVNPEENLFTLESQDEQLLPGLSNEIVLEEIVTKLSWKVFYILSSVSRSWKQVIQNHQVYNARVRSHATEALLLFNHPIPPPVPHDSSSTYMQALFLYSVKDKFWLRLPLLPHANGTLRYGSKFLSLEGKIYVLGGDRTFHQASNEVYVLDLSAGQGEWKRCANMLQPRNFFKCSTINEKIYVFGCVNNDIDIRGCEVYDPKENTWSAIAELEFTGGLGVLGHVVTVGEELLLNRGLTFQAEAIWDAEVYHPGRDEWRHETNIQISPLERLFISHGKLHRMTLSGIDVYYMEENLWRRLKSFAFLDDEATTTRFLENIVAVNDDLFALYVGGPSSFRIAKGPSFFQGKGFASAKEQIVWEKLICPFAFEEQPSINNFQSSMCTIQL